MLHWGLGLAAVLIPVQLFFGHLTGLYVLQHQPAKFAAIEARWQSQQPASEVLIAWPDAASQRNLFAIEIPRLGSFIASGNWTAREIGLDTFPVEDRPPVLIPFFGFRIMVGMGLIMLGVSWLGTSCAGASGWRRRAGSSGARSCRSRPGSSRSCAAGTPPRSAASPGSSTASCAPRTR